MKLRNKKTGEIDYYLHTHRDHKTGVLKVAVLKDGVPFSEFKPYEPIYDYDSLAELNAEWEDEEEYKGPKEYWRIDCDGSISQGKNEFDTPFDNNCKAIGNYFESEEEAEKAVEKLKAWKRLKDKGFRFILDGETEMPMFVYSGANGEKCITSAEESKQCRNDIKLLFGGEE